MSCSFPANEMLLLTRPALFSLLPSRMQPHWKKKMLLTSWAKRLDAMAKLPRSELLLCAPEQARCTKLISASICYHLPVSGHYYPQDNTIENQCPRSNR